MEINNINSVGISGKRKKHREGQEREIYYLVIYLVM